MEKKFKFEGLLVWQRAIEMGELVNGLISNFPEKEKFNLSSQMIRACDSIALNIAEGSIYQSQKEFKKFLSYAIRSLAELITCFHKSKLRNYISEKEFRLYYEDTFILMNMLVAFRKKV